MEVVNSRKTIRNYIKKAVVMNIDSPDTHEQLTRVDRFKGEFRLK